MGIEPTGVNSRSLPNGFEARGDHQTPFASDHILFRSCSDLSQYSRDIVQMYIIIFNA